MYTPKTIWAEVDNEGRLIIPQELKSQFGLIPGSRARIDTNSNSFRVHRPLTHLAKVYIEPTNQCNLKCSTCIRNNWEVDLGKMSLDTFYKILNELKFMTPPPTIFFGGLGEPLSHPNIVEMVLNAKEIGSRVEVITNATLLDKKLSKDLIDAKLDVLWASIDGASPESYGDIRLGARLPDVIANLKQFRSLRPFQHRPKPEIGIVFVAMKQNIADLPKVLSLGRTLRARYFMVSNLLPYTADMQSQILYQRTTHNITYIPSSWVPQLSLPNMDLDDTTQEAFLEALRSGYNVILSGNNLGANNDVCTFIEEGSITIGWNGNVAPCPPLLYNHTGYVNNYKRFSHQHIIGNIKENKLSDLWLEPNYVAYRERVHSFAFAPCTACGGCEMLEGNEEDCLGNQFPSCGACLWAQGIIQCP